MTTENKLFAIFLGWKIDTFKGKEYITDINGTVYSEYDEILIDWNFLMAVVDKIKSMGYYVNILIGAWTIVQIGKGNNKLFRSEEDKTIEAVYTACVDFIKWHNDQQSNNL